MRNKVLLLKFFSFLALCFLISIAKAQTGTLKGTVKDAGGPVNGASVSIGSRGASTNSNGEFSIKLKPGTYTVTITYIGNKPYSTTVTITENQETIVDANLEASAGAGEEIVLVGTRSSARSKLNTPVPVDVITSREIKSYAQMDATQVLTYAAPSFQSARQTISDGTDHIDPAGLRSLGPDQTLVLLNGKRRHNTALVNINGTVGRGSVGTDLNAIPTAAIERIEVLRDGAAAQYGSDAIAGVINVVLKKKYSGMNVSVTAGENNTLLKYGGGIRMNDGATRQIDFSAGKSGALGYVNLSGQWLDRERTNRSGNDNIPMIYVGNGGAFPATQAGVDVVDYRRFLINYDNNLTAQKGYDRHNLYAGQSASENFGTFLNAGTNLSVNTELYFTAGLSKRTGFATGFSRNPNSVAQQPVYDGGSQVYPDGFLPEIHTTINDASMIAGVKTKWKNWGIDVSNTYGKNKLGYDIKNTGNASLTGAAMPQTIFYAGALSFTQNTINLDLSRKFNEFNLAFGGEARTEKFGIEAGETNSYINGGRIAQVPFIPSYPGTAGTSSTTGTNVVPASGSQVFPGFQPGDVTNASRNIYAGYVDGEYATDKFLLSAAARYESYKEKNVTYNGTGLKLTGRVELTNNWALRASVNTGFRAPSLHQRYFQNTSTQFVNGLPSNALTANNNNPIVRNAFGINELKPEKSTSFTAGVVGNLGNGFSVTLDGYYIMIKDRIVLSTQFNRSNALVNTIMTANNVDPSVSALQFWTNAIDTKTSGIDIVVSKKFKLGKGDAVFSLAGNFNENKVDGSLKTNSVIDAPSNNPSLTDATKNPANDLSAALFDRLQKSRIEVAQPKSKINASFNYTLNRLNVLLRSVRFGETVLLSAADPKAVNGSGVYWNDVALGADQTFSAKITTDMVVSYRFNRGLTFSVGANNLFDVYPDRLFLDPRNEAATVYNNPVQSALTTNKTLGGYNAGRDLTNRGRFLFGSNQFGSNGRFIFARLNVDIKELTKCTKPKK